MFQLVGVECLLKCARGFTVFIVSDLTSEQFEKLWEYSAAFDDSCLTIAFENKALLQDAIDDGLSPEKLVTKYRRAKAEVFVAEPFCASLAIDLLEDGHALDMAFTLPADHPVSIWCDKNKHAEDNQ